MATPVDPHGRRARGIGSAGDGAGRALVRPFPRPGSRVRHAYRELHLAATGSTQQRAALGDPTLLPRPWAPASCTDTGLREEVWEWLEQVVTWLNHEYVWHAEDTVLACWPQHPHLVHEVAVLADQRHQAGQALGSDALEDWHRYSLPAFQDRTRARLHGHCQDGHDPWPARGRHTGHTTDPAHRARTTAYEADLALPDNPSRPAPHHPPGPTSDGASGGRLQVVDLETGELYDS